MNPYGDSCGMLFTNDLTSKFIISLPFFFNKLYEIAIA